VNEPRKLNVLPDNPEKENPNSHCGIGRFPSWLHRSLPKGSNFPFTDKKLKDHLLPTVCEEAFCPNILDCWAKKTATFLVLGKECTRSCGFCSVDFAKKPAAPMEDEPDRVAKSVLELGLSHVVLTMPARDDLFDGGSSYLKRIIDALRQRCPHSTIEILTSDFHGNKSSWEEVSKMDIEIFNHNLETVRRLTPRVRHRATYDQSLSFLKYMKEHSPRPLIKSGFMVGLGETSDEVEATLEDLARAKIDIVTIGQYLQSHPQKLRVKSFITPQEFDRYASLGKKLGIPHLFSAPFMRSSYNAEAVFKEVRRS
jgi:lipoyl synthase